MFHREHVLEFSLQPSDMSERMGMRTQVHCASTREMNIGRKMCVPLLITYHIALKLPVHRSAFPTKS